MLSRVSVPVYRTVSLTFDQMQHWYYGNLLDQILPNLYLGTIPTTATLFGEACANSDNKIIDFVNKRNPDAPLKLIVSVVEPDELKGEGFYGTKMVQPEDWKKHNIEHRLVNMVDRTAVVDNKVAIETVFKMKECTDAGGSVYVHCKAGHSRSAMFCVIYLALFVENPKTNKKYTVDEAFHFLKEKRAQVSLKGDKLAKAKEIVNLVVPNSELEQKEEATSYYSNVANFWNKSDCNKAITVASTVAAGVAVVATVSHFSK